MVDTWSTVFRCNRRYDHVYAEACYVTVMVRYLLPNARPYNCIYNDVSPCKHHVSGCTAVYIDVTVHLRFKAIYIAVHQITRWCNATYPHVDGCEIHHCVFLGYIGLHRITSRYTWCKRMYYIVYRCNSSPPLWSHIHRGTSNYPMV